MKVKVDLAAKAAAEKEENAFMGPGPTPVEYEKLLAADPCQDAPYKTLQCKRCYYEDKGKLFYQKQNPYEAIPLAHNRQCPHWEGEEEQLFALNGI